MKIKQALASVLGSAAMLLGIAAALAQDNADTSNVVPAARATVRYTNGELRLVDLSFMRKVLPQSDTLPAVQRELTGFWYEVRAGDGSLRYRRILSNPFLLTFEGPALGQKANVPSRVESLPQDPVMSFLIPAPVEGDELVLYGPGIEVDPHGKPAIELGRVLLRDQIIR